MKNYRILMAYLTWLCVASSAPLTAEAGERESLEQLRSTTLSLINALVDQGVLSKDKADTLIKQAEAAKQATNLSKDAAVANTNAGDADENVVHVQYVPEHVKKQLREEIKQEVMAKAQSEGWAYPGSIPDWLSRIEWDGDVRLRYERDSFNNPLTINGTPLLTILQSNPYRNVPSSNLDNVNEDRNRYRLRARLGANANINSWLSGGIRLTTGSTSDPVSPNQTEGMSSANGSSSAKYSFALDRAFLKAQVFPWLSVTGGRFANPFFSTDLVWDPDLAFDGVVGNVKTKINDKVSVFGTLGAFPLDEIQTNGSTNLAKSKWLYGMQGGINWKAMRNTEVKVGVAYYDYENVAGIANTANATPYSATAPVYRQKGNNVFDLNAGTNNSGSIYGLVNDFRELNFTGNKLFLAKFQNAGKDLLSLDKGGKYQHSALFKLYAAGLREIKKREHDGQQIQLSGASIDAIKAAVDADLVRETQRQNAGMVLLTIAISGGPFLGLLGTVVGVMITFAAIAAAGDVNVNAIAPGIAAALLATVAGLGVAIPALFGYNYLASRVKNITIEMQIFVDEFITRIAELYGKE